MTESPLQVDGLLPGETISDGIARLERRHMERINENRCPYRRPYGLPVQCIHDEGHDGQHECGVKW